MSKKTKVNAGILIIGTKFYLDELKIPIRRQ